MNNEKTRLIGGKEPSDAIELESMDIGEKNYKRIVGLDENLLPGFTQVRYLYSDGELEGGEKRRATDPIWSLEIYDLDRNIVSPNQPVLYYLQSKQIKRGFVREELQVVSEEDTELPPDTILK